MDAVTVFLLLAVGRLVFGQTCEETHYERCMAQLLSFTNKGNLIFASSDEELRRECVQAQSALSCLTRYSRKCLSLEERDKLSNLIFGPQKIVVGLCSEGSQFKSNYMDVLPCIRNASEGVQYCREKYNRNQRDISVVEYEDKFHLRCCSFDGYRRCLQMLMTLQSSCRDDIVAVVDEIVLSQWGNDHMICKEYFDQCYGSGAACMASANVFAISTLSILLLMFFIRKR